MIMETATNTRAQDLLQKLDRAGAPLVCIPLIGQTEAELVDEAQEIVRLAPDLIEWRADTFSGDEVDLGKALKKIRDAVGGIPILFTCRIAAEGGLYKQAPDTRLQIFQTIMASGLVEMVDVELACGSKILAAIKKDAAKEGVLLVVSYHDFVETPVKQEIYEKLAMAKDYGADIAKISVMATSPSDALILLQASHEAKEILQMPLISIAMGKDGAISRIAGGLFGSRITFAMGPKSSAPGQIPVAELRQAMTLLY